MSSTVTGADELDESDVLVRIGTTAGLAQCRGCGSGDSKGECEDPITMEPLTAPAYKNTSNGRCYGEDGAMELIASKHPRPAPDPMTRKPWKLPAELSARIPGSVRAAGNHGSVRAAGNHGFSPFIIQGLLVGGHTQRAINLFRNTIDCVDFYNCVLNDSVLLHMIENGMKSQAKTWFWKTIRYRTQFNFYVMNRMNTLGLKEEAKALFQETFVYLYVYKDTYIRELMNNWNNWDSGEAATLFEHSKRFCKPQNEGRMNETRRMLYGAQTAG